MKENRSDPREERGKAWECSGFSDKITRDFEE